MHTVYLIGNGFDVNLGLPTRYSDFYDYYLGLDRSDDSENIKKLKDHLKRCLSEKNKYWSDLEEAMGNYTTEFSSYEEMEEVYDNLNDEMQKYISTIEKSKLPNEINAGLLKKNIAAPESFLTAASRETVNHIYNKISHDTHWIAIVDFNYTTTLEKILQYPNGPMELAKASYNSNYKAHLRKIYHIHGNVEQPILGINDISQIKNEGLRANIDVQEYLIKPAINSTLGHLIDRQTMQSIKNANLICIYGLSLGATDRAWWELIGQRLLSGIYVILFVYDDCAKNLVPRKIGRYIRSMKTKLCDVANIGNEVREKVMERIIVAPNTPIFDVKNKA